MTKEEFERGYARRGGISIDQLRVWGRGAVPCDCGEPECQGWAMVNLANHRDHLRMIEAITAEREKQDILGRLAFLLYQLEQADQKEEFDGESLLKQIKESVADGFRYADKYERTSGNTLGAKEMRCACNKVLATLPPD